MQSRYFIFLILMLIISAVINIKSLGQQIGQKRLDVQNNFKQANISFQEGSLFSKDKVENNIVATLDDFGYVESGFINEECYVIIYAPKDIIKARQFISKLNETFLSNDNELWKGFENNQFVEIKLYYISNNGSNGTIFVKKRAVKQ